MEVLAGRTNFDPNRLLSFIEQLPEESALKAALQGGPEYRDWGIQTHILASIYDALNTNTVVSGHWAKKAPTIPQYPRPGTASAEPKKPQTLEGLHSMFVGQLDAGYAHTL